jgi:hypothetical protein
VPVLGAKERLSYDHRSGGFVSRIAGCGQAERDNKTRRRKPLKAERPISVSSVASPTRQPICQCWKKSFGFVGRG